MARQLTDEYLKEVLTPEQYEEYLKTREEEGETEALCTLPDLGKEFYTSDEEYTLVNGRIKELRIENGLTQVELANVLGVSHKEYWRYEQFGYSLSILRLAQIALFYNVSIDWFSGYIDKKKPFIENTKIYEANIVNGYVLKEMKEAKSRGEKYKPHRHGEDQAEQ